MIIIIIIISTIIIIIINNIIDIPSLGVHGVMVGRAIVNAPFYWKNTDSMLYDKENTG